MAFVKPIYVAGFTSLFGPVLAMTYIGHAFCSNHVVFDGFKMEPDVTELAYFDTVLWTFVPDMRESVFTSTFVLHAHIDTGFGVVATIACHTEHLVRQRSRLVSVQHHQLVVSLLVNWLLFGHVVVQAFGTNFEGMFEAVLTACCGSMATGASILRADFSFDAVGGLGDNVVTDVAEKARLDAVGYAVGAEDGGAVVAGADVLLTDVVFAVETVATRTA